MYKIEAQVDTKQLLQAVEQMPQPDEREVCNTGIETARDGAKSNRFHDQSLN